MTKIQHIFLAAAAALAAAFQASAAKPAVVNVPVSNVSVDRVDGRLSLSFTIDPSDLHIGSSREIVARPELLDSVGNVAQFPAVVFAGRSRYLIHERFNDVPSADTLVRASSGNAIQYSASIPWQQWMETSSLDMTLDLRGCQCAPIDHTRYPMIEIDLVPLVFSPQFVLATPVASGEKTRQLNGSAYIDFPVNKTELYPDYRRNPEELASIRASIDRVRNDLDAVITKITIKGYASPEGPYNNNVRLAKGRTQTLRDYVQGLYAFNPSIMHSDWEAEDWTGLRKYIENSDFQSRDAMLRLIDSDLEPDAKDKKLKKDFPKDYAYLLKNVYPALRHSDYTVDYVIRSFSDVNEIAERLRTDPSKLSLNELMLLAQSLDPQSDEYADVFDAAVVMFPTDTVANLNAAVINMRRGNFDKAQSYLSRADESNETVYARGVMQGLQGDYVAAEQTLGTIAAVMPEAADALAQIQKIISRSKK